MSHLLSDAAGVPGLLPFQVEGVKALVERPALLLADDMGLGKTMQAIHALREVLSGDPAAKALVIVPAGLVGQWRSEFQRWSPDLLLSTIRGPVSDRAWQWRASANVFVVSYDTFRSDFTLNPHAPVAREWDVVILDEAQRIKNRDTTIARCCKQIVRRRAWALTGTPLENTLDDLASVLEFVRPRRRDDRLPPLRVDDRALLPLHRSVQLRRRKIDVLPELPAKTVIPLALELTEGQRASYERAERAGIIRLRELGPDVRIEHVLELITRLKQICNFCPQTGESAKIEDLRHRMATLVAEDERALVFSQYVDDRFGVHRIAASLAAFEPLSYTGGLSQQERERVIERFREDRRHRVLILSLRAGGVGLNLQEASYVFHFDRWWNPAVERQAEDRTHRMGQVKPVFIYTYTCVNTIEERVAAILARKRALFDEVVDTTSIDLRASLSLQELLALFGLHRPTTKD
jgi:SNF2 family DNA or RNA helicase